MKTNRLLAIVVCTVIGLGFTVAPFSFNAAEGGFRVAESWAASDKAKKDKKEKKEKKAKKDKSCTRDQPCNDANEKRKKK
jgi:hypothetical protein